MAMEKPGNWACQVDVEIARPLAEEEPEAGPRGVHAVRTTPDGIVRRRPREDAALGAGARQPLRGGGLWCKGAADAKAKAFA
jgi:hypothetical protein